MNIKDFFNNLMNKIKKLLAGIQNSPDTSSIPEDPVDPVDTETPEVPDVPDVPHDGDAVSFSQLKWTCGKFKGSDAKRDEGVVISSLSVNSSGMSYKWVKGNCEKMGAANGNDYSKTVACLFCKVGDKWEGGMFDKISTSRTTRDFKNIYKPYDNWPSIKFSDVKEFCFLIAGVNKKRSNVIYFKKT